MPRSAVRQTPFAGDRAAGPLAGALALLAVLSGGTGTASAQDGADCEAMGDTLAAARGAYAAACPSIPRLDCDPVIGGWACASYRIGLYAPATSQSQAMPAPSSSEPQPPAGEAEPVEVAPLPSAAGAPGYGDCRWIDGSLEGAQGGYATFCRVEMDACDPVPEGWMCVSERIGAGAPDDASDGPVAGLDGGAVPDPVTMAPEPAPAPVAPPPAPDGGGAPAGDAPGGGTGDGGSGSDPAPEPPAPAAPPAPASPPAAQSVYGGRFGEPSVSWADSYSANGTCYAATTGDHGVLDLRVDTPTGRTTVREALGRIEQGPGISRADALYNDVRCGRGPANDVGDEDPDQCPGRVDRGRAGCGTIGPDWKFVR